MLIVFLVQAIVPVGYMPASLADDGVLVKFCPSGVSDELMAILHAGHNSPDQQSGHDEHFAHDHHAHHHSSHVSPGMDVSEADSSHAGHADSVWQSDCDYGIAKPSSDDLFNAGVVFDAEPALRYQQQLLVADGVAARLYRKQQQRAPPIFS